MNELYLTMSSDMGISRFHNETEYSFVYRLCYSALGLWCLRIAQNLSDSISGTSKHNQTIVLNDLLIRFSELSPSMLDKFIDSSKPQMNFPVHIRRVYEETGYLLTDENNRNRIANYGRSILIGSEALFFGIPKTKYKVNGLGIFASPTAYVIPTKEFLIRDFLTCEEFYKTQFDAVDFYDRDIEIEELEFFNPQSNNVPSRSWGKQLQTDCTVARKTETGPFYRIMRVADTLLYADEPIVPQSDSFISYEYRRLYFALKAHYKKPLIVNITDLDEEYSKIRVGGHLPNREYYYLCLLSWPMKNAFDKVTFIIRNIFLPEIIAVLTNIGIEIRGGYLNDK